jgi:menaquinone-specific isochorismate synthase
MSHEVMPRLFGGFSFDPFASGDPLWPGFEDAVLILPEVMYVRDSDGSHLHVTLAVPPGLREDELLRRLEEKTARFGPPPGAPTEVILPEIQVIADNCDAAEWMDAVRTALGRIEEGVLEKVVLSRRIRVSARARFPVWPVLHRLRQGSPDCYHFGFRLAHDRSFVGASPECLFRLKGREIETECIAGTVERGVDAATDRQLSDWLLASEKDRREHFYVVEDCLQCLGGICESMNADMTPRVLSLSTLQHLSTQVRGTLKAGVAVGDILRLLHPTPAVGGTPRDTALAAIRELEPNPRGWYAGPVGWWEPDRAEFAVGIRSAMIAGSEAHVFAGAGIVSGSTPEREWHETQSKAHAFLKALQE